MSALSMSSSSVGEAQWPFYTQDDFAGFGQSFLQGSGATMVSWSPIVSGDANRRVWGNYSVWNDAWVEQGLEWQVEHQGLEMPSGPLDVPSQIYTKDIADGGLMAPEAGSGPFAPVWQMAGAPTDPSVVNYNLLSEEDFKVAFEAATDSGAQTFSKIVDDAAWYYGESALPKDGVNGPQGFIITPLFDTVSDDSNAVGAVVAAFSWDDYFKNVLLKGTPMVYVVVGAPECGGTFTFGVTGQQVNYLGEGDKHKQADDDLQLGGKFAEDQTAYMDCTYSLKVYPSQEFVDTYQNKDPVWWTLFVVAILLMTSVVFFLYDFFAQKRQFKYLASAAKSNAIVSSLFPAEVRDRLFGRDAEPAENINPANFPESSKLRLQSYLNTGNNNPDTEEGSTGNISASERIERADKNAIAQNASTGVDMYETKPIADLFPNTTIMFADIAGFTAWSSVREPSQVFTLLESVYSAFDAIAKRRKVFKVETVGDCYVAVAGLPEPRSDHAVVMAKFSRECLDKFNALTKQLEISLGPDTADLAMRAGVSIIRLSSCGPVYSLMIHWILTYSVRIYLLDLSQLHSGPVTAGVLRGDKSRFQLFGDTVNLAARIEHTGLRNRVHLSQDTADLLMKGGKEHWTRKRTEMVSGKGKGKMQTYWLHTPGQSTEEDPDAKAAEQSLNARSTNKRNLPLDELEDSLPPKVKRLVGWNCEILKKLLQQIVAKRTAMGNKRNYDVKLKTMEAAYAKRQYLMDEVTEIISLPKFDATHHKTKFGSVKEPLPEKVVEQLKLYVSAVAAMHQDNPFHNFEHAR
jgi:class 3 adenylate cyclase